MMKTAVVILNWNTKQYLRRFLPGLLKSLEGLDAGAVVADNASSDGSVRMMEEEFPSVRLIPLKENYGFTGGYNRALAEVEAEYFVLLNSDVEVPEGWLEPLVEWMDSHPECGACGPKLLRFEERDTFEYAGAAGGLIDRFGYPFCRGRVMKWYEKDHGQYDKPEDVMWVSGAAMMIRSRLWRELGGLDGRFFAHMEEIDLCWRLQLEGYRVTTVPSSYIYHIGGGTLPNDSPRKLFLNYRNNLLLLDNNAGKTFALRGMKHPRRKADFLIFKRMVLDGLSGIVYLCSGKWSFFKSVTGAHKEFRRLRRRPSASEIEAYRGRGYDVRGIYRKWLIPRALIKREKICESLSKEPVR